MDGDFFLLFLASAALGKRMIRRSLTATPRQSVQSDSSSQIVQNIGGVKSVTFLAYQSDRK